MTNGATLTCPASTATQMHKLEVEVAGTITVDGTSLIDVSGRVYVGGYHSGNVTNSALAGNGGGSFGGLGGGAASGVYGDYADPEDWGSGGTKGPGGGQVRLEADWLQLDGQLLANGAASCNGGAGAGGGVLVMVGTLAGNGLVQASGGGQVCGNGGTAGGGGGRIAVYAQNLAGVNTNGFVARGGGGTATDGGAGTVYLRDTDEPFWTLIIDETTGPVGWTPLGLPGTNQLVVPDRVIIRGVNAYVRAEHPGLVLEFQNELRIENSALFIVDGTSLVLDVPPVVRNGGQLQVAGPWTLNVPLTLTTNGLITVSGVVKSTGPS